MKASKLTTAAVALALALSAGITAVTAETVNRISQAHVMLGLTYAKAGDIVNAVGEFEQVLEDGVPATEYAREMACVYYEVGSSFLLTYDLPEAQRYLERAVLLNRECEAGRYALALTYSLMAEEQLELGNRQLANRLLNDANTLVPGFDADVAYLSLAKNSRTVCAVQEMSTNLVLTYRAVGREYAKEKQFTEARKYYAMAAEMAPADRNIARELQEVDDVIAGYSDSRMAVVTE